MLCEVRDEINPGMHVTCAAPAEKCLVEGCLGGVICQLCPDCQEAFKLRGYTVTVLPKETN